MGLSNTFTPLNWRLVSHLAMEAYQNISGGAQNFFLYHKGTVIALNNSWSFTPAVWSALQTRLMFTMESSHCALTAWLFWFCMLHKRDLNFCCFWLPVNNAAQAAHTAALFMISFLFVKVCNAKAGVFSSWKSRKEVQVIQNAWKFSYKDSVLPKVLFIVTYAQTKPSHKLRV